MLIFVILYVIVGYVFYRAVLASKGNNPVLCGVFWIFWIMCLPLILLYSEVIKPYLKNKKQ